MSVLWSEVSRFGQSGDYARAAKAVSKSEAPSCPWPRHPALSPPPAGRMAPPALHSGSNGPARYLRRLRGRGGAFQGQRPVQAHVSFKKACSVGGLAPRRVAWAPQELPPHFSFVKK